MCGFVGILKKQERVDANTLNLMIAELKHRGPDDQSVWTENNVGLAHARLSIQDLSSIANQPMLSLTQRFVIAFNGEIYNYLELRKELMHEYALNFRTYGDTEVLVNAIELWGLEKTLNKCVGMFAFAAWDRKEKKLYLARDRFGEKPLYYGQLKNDFVFASELKSITKIYKDNLNINRDVLATYMNYCYVPKPYCIYSELKKLQPGAYLIVDSMLNVFEKIYWSAIEVALQPKIDLSFNDAVQELEKKLQLTLSQQMLSNVPLGAFLSGGVDSSAIVALMQSISTQPIKTFSIGFNEKKYDESIYAKAVARHLNTDHTELNVTDKCALSVIPKLSCIYDEPFADSSQIPIFLVSQLAKQSVTVSLSGDGGDEVFGGYSRYFLAHRIKAILGNGMINRLLQYCPEYFFDFLDYIPQKKFMHLSGKFRKAQHMAKALRGSFLEMHQSSCIQHHQNFVLSGRDFPVVGKFEHFGLSKNLSNVETMMLIDTLNYLTDDILVKVDRAAMAVSLETRVPFLDHRIFEFAWSLPEKYKVTSGRGKLVLRELLYRHVPRSLIDRPKMGFAIPLGQWLRGSLAGWVEDLLDENKLNQQGYLNASLVRRYWHEHKAGKHNWQGILWNILMFQQWLEHSNQGT